jgi:hypothetical protein
MAMMRLARSSRGYSGLPLGALYPTPDLAGPLERGLAFGTDIDLVGPDGSVVLIYCLPFPA